MVGVVAAARGGGGGSRAAARRSQRAAGTAAILAIGTANPPNAVDQASFSDYYFRVTNSEHMVELKNKFTRVCGKTSVKKRYMTLTEDVLEKNPNMCAFMASSLDARQDILIKEVPKLGEAAALAAIAEWGGSLSDITHLVFCAMSGVDMPGADYQLLRLLGLSPSVKRLMIYQQGCFAGGTVLRIAKDLAENNAGARVLVVCAEIMALVFRGPNEAHFDSLVGQAIFGDGAAALVVGVDPVQAERAIFEIGACTQAAIPGCDAAVSGHLIEAGLTFHLSNRVPDIIAKNVERFVDAAFRPLGVSDWNELFYITHPGGPAILDKMEKELRLVPEKMEMAREVLRDYGNMSSATVFFIMDAMRRRSAEDMKETTGEGCKFGALFGFGPGLTMEMVVLRAMPCLAMHSLIN